MDKINVLINELQKVNCKVNLYNKAWLRTWDRSVEELKATVLIAQILEEMYKMNIDTRCFNTGLAVSIFRDNSTRTRFSFASAANLLGLTVMDLDEEKSQIAHGETVRETAVMISFLTQVIGIRDDMFIGEGHKYEAEVAGILQEAYLEKTLVQIPSVINLQCDEDHPTQAMSDLVHLINHFGGIEGLKGKKLAMTWAYSPSYGKPLSVPQGIIALMSRFGMNVHLAYPKEYALIPEIVETAKKFSAETGGTFTVSNDMDAAFKDADVVYPKSWAPVVIMEKRSVLLKQGKGVSQEMKDLEKECLGMNANYKSWECTEAKMATTKGGDALYMHCLPADITGLSCKEGEVANAVFDKARVDTYLEASHKPFIISSMIIQTRFPNAVDVVKGLVKRAGTRTIIA